MAENQKPEEPDFRKFEEELNLSPLDEDAFQMFELFNSLLRAGFRERQALTLVAMIVNDANESEFFYSAVEDDEDDEGLNTDERK
jgi:hypothetical protein